MYLSHSSQQVLNVGQLAVVVGQNGLNSINQELQRLSTGLQLLLPLLLSPLLNFQFIQQLPLGTTQPIRTTYGQVWHWTLRIEKEVNSSPKNSSSNKHSYKWFNTM